ncbi:hypothetical protein [Streptomyces yanii]|uniref:Uncharacterized protein n=1 Tax=Streptomyces yanii TaxID=78510 RepID=A0ABV5RFF9_9ACTN
MTENTSKLHDENGEDGDASTTHPIEEILTFDHPGGDSLELADLLTGRSMARRLPSLIRRTFSLAWEVDPRAVAVLLACQIVSGLTSSPP